MRTPLSIFAALFAALVVAAFAAAASPISTAAVTKACLSNRGAKFQTGAPTLLSRYAYPEIRAEFDWIIGRRKVSSSETETFYLDILFTRNAADSRKLAERIIRLGTSMGFTKSQVSHAMGQRGSVLWTAWPRHPASAKQLSFLRKCLAA